MADLIFVAVVVGFFAVCVLFVRGCDLIIGPDPDLGAEVTARDASSPSVNEEPVTAGADR